MAITRLDPNTVYLGGPRTVDPLRYGKGAKASAAVPISSERRLCMRVSLVGRVRR